MVNTVPPVLPRSFAALSRHLNLVGKILHENQSILTGEQKNEFFFHLRALNATMMFRRAPPLLQGSLAAF